MKLTKVLFRQLKEDSNLIETSGLFRLIHGLIFSFLFSFLVFASLNVMRKRLSECDFKFWKLLKFSVIFHPIIQILRTILNKIFCSKYFRWLDLTGRCIFVSLSLRQKFHPNTIFISLFQNVLKWWLFISIIYC